MNTNQLKCFISLARTLNFTEAAKQNYITQPAMSRVIHELEQSLGVKLLYRTRHSVVLTEEGREFLRYAEDEITNENEIRLRLHNIEAGHSGCVRIAVLSDMVYMLMKCMTEFTDRYPSVQYKIDRVPGQGLAAAMQERQHDFFFGAEDSFSSTHGFRYVVTHHERYVLAVPKRLAGQIDPGDISTFRQLPFAFISRSAGPLFYDRIMAFCESIGYRPPIMSYFNCAEAIMLAVNAGVGISVLNESGAKSSCLENVVLLPFRTEYTALSGAIGWRANCISSTPKKFLSVIEELFPEAMRRVHET